MRALTPTQPAAQQARQAFVRQFQEFLVKTHLHRILGTLLLSLSALAAHAQSVEGEVKKIDLDAGKVTLKHGEIKNLDMPAMQMAFRVSDPAWLKRLQVGDKVTFTADKVNGQFTVTAIDVKK
jgi:Cu(I)/Ag(I) efflux system protein CusF